MDVKACVTEILWEGLPLAIDMNTQQSDPRSHEPYSVIQKDLISDSEADVPWTTLHGGDLVEVGPASS